MDSGSVRPAFCADEPSEAIHGASGSADGCGPCGVRAEPRGRDHLRTRNARRGRAAVASRSAPAGGLALRGVRRPCDDTRRHLRAHYGCPASRHPRACGGTCPAILPHGWRGCGGLRSSEHRPPKLRAMPARSAQRQGNREVETRPSRTSRAGVAVHATPRKAEPRVTSPPQHRGSLASRGQRIPVVYPRRFIGMQLPRLQWPRGTVLRGSGRPSLRWARRARIPKSWRTLLRGSGRSAYEGPGGPAYRGPGGPAYDGPGGPAYSGPGGPCYAGAGGPCYRIGNSSPSDCPSVCR